MSSQPIEPLARASDEDWLLLEYDYFKHLSTISLVSLGAILAWLDNREGAPPPLFMIGLSLVVISSVLGFGAMNHIIGHRKSGRPLRALFRWERTITSITFAAGIGLFMSEIGGIGN